LYKNIIDCDSSDILKDFIQRRDENVLYVILYSHIINICRKCTLNVFECCSRVERLWLRHFSF